MLARGEEIDAYIFFNFFSCSVIFGGSIKDVCPNAGSTYRTKITEVMENVCLKSHGFKGDRLLQLYSDILNALSKYPQDIDFTSISESENTKLVELARELNSHARPNSFALATIFDNAAKAQLRQLLLSKGDLKSATDQEKIVDLLNQTLMQTAAGRQTLNSFREDVGPGKQFSSVDIKFQAESQEQEWSGLFEFENDAITIKLKLFNTKKIKLITSLDPLFLLLVYAHEMQHGCNLEKKYALNAKAEKYLAFAKFGAHPDCVFEPAKDVNFCNDWRKQKETVLAEYYQEHLIDEVRSFALMVSLFKELATIEPDWVCNLVIYRKRPGFFGGVGLVSLADDFAFIEEKFRDGTMAKYIANEYSKIANYDRVYLFSENNLRPDFVERLTKAGYGSLAR